MNIKSSILSILLSSLIINFAAAQFNFDWVAQIGGGGSEEGRSLACDQAGNIYSTGYFNGTVDFDPGANTFNLSSNGSGYVYVQKLNTNGDLLWALKFGGTGWDFGSSICIDPLGNVLLTGYFSGTVDFDPGPGSNLLTSNGTNDAFIVKLDQNGNFLWAKSIGGTGAEEGNSICANANGEVYAVGFFYGSVDFDPGAGVNTFTSAGQNDIFVLKLDASGNALWARQFGSTYSDVAKALCLDNSGNPVITGYFQGTVDFDPGAGVSNFTSSSQGIYALKLNASGDYLWAKAVVGTGPAYGLGVCQDLTGNTIVTGTFYGTADFDPSGAVLNLTSSGSDDGFIQKLDPSGNLLWAKKIGGSYSDYSFAVTTDAAGNVYSTGIFDATVDFDPGPGSFPISTNGSNDAFILQLMANGDFGWAQQIGGADADAGYSIAFDNNENLLVNGYFYFTVDFDPGVGVSNVASNGATDAFVLKLTDCLPSSGVDNQVICGSSYTWMDGITYTQNTNTPTWNLPNAGGCDSVVTLNLSFLPTYSSTHSVTRCNYYTWIDGITYTSSNNTATFTLQAANGCDSVITLNLNIGPYSYAGNDVITACNAYTWIDGITYTSSNNSATYYYTAIDNCDSIIYLDLTILNVDATLSQNGATLTANNSNAQYQWVTCPQLAPIPGETNQSFTATVNGAYACIVNDGTCTDTSDCITISNLGLDEMEGFPALIYPNPVTDMLQVQSEKPIDLIRIFSLTGELLDLAYDSKISLHHLASGLYVVDVESTDGKHYRSRFLKD